MAVPPTVVIATRNRREELLRTLTRLQALPEQPPIVVVDDGSADGTGEVVRSAFPAVQLVTLPASSGAAARNVGARLARTPYVAFSDDDSWWEPGALTRAAETLAAHPRLGLLAGRIELDAAGTADRVSERMAAAPLGWEPDLPGPSILGFPACAAVVRRHAFLASGGFSDLLSPGGAEELLALDLAAAGWGLAYVPAVTASRRPGPGCGTDPARWALHRRNDALVAWMRLSWACALCGTWQLAAKAAGDTAARDALRSLLVRLPAVLGRRRRIAPAWEERLRIARELA